MRNARVSASTALIILFCAACGCSSTRIASESKNTNLAGAQYKRVLVVGVSADRGVRQLFEEEFVKALQSRGVTGIPSYQHLPADKPTREAVQQAAQSLHADAVLISRLVERKAETQLDPGTPGGPANISGYYDDAWKGSYEAPSVYTVTVVRIETRLFDAATGNPAWSAETDTFDPTDREKEIRNLASVLTKAMAKQHLLEQRAKVSCGSMKDLHASRQGASSTNDIDA